MPEHKKEIFAYEIDQVGNRYFLWTIDLLKLRTRGVKQARKKLITSAYQKRILIEFVEDIKIRNPDDEILAVVRFQ